MTGLVDFMTSYKKHLGKPGEVTIEEFFGFMLTLANSHCTYVLSGRLFGIFYQALGFPLASCDE
jgi:hypothetical protein